MAVPVEWLSIDLHGVSHAFPILSIVDRRPRTASRKQWVLVRAVEKLTHGVGNIRSAGQLAKHLMDCSMEHSILVADKAAVQSGTITQDEFDAGTRAPRAGLACTHLLTWCWSPICSSRRDASAD